TLLSEAAVAQHAVSRALDDAELDVHADGLEVSGDRLTDLLALHGPTRSDVDGDLVLRVVTRVLALFLRAVRVVWIRRVVAVGDAAPTRVGQVPAARRLAIEQRRHDRLAVDRVRDRLSHAELLQLGVPNRIHREREHLGGLTGLEVGHERGVLGADVPD